MNINVENYSGDKMANYKDKIIHTLKVHAAAHVQKHIMNANILMGSHVGVAEHPDLIETIEKELMEAAKYQDVLDMVEKHL
jgi:hypothetical protein